MSYTLYDILEVSSHASPEIIRSAYRTLARQYHPDKMPGRGSTALMGEINRAYAILSDPVTRKGYDASMAAAASEAADHRRSYSRRHPERSAEAHTPPPRAKGKSSAQGSAGGDPRSHGPHKRNPDPPPNARGPRLRETTGVLVPTRQSAKKQWVFLIGFATLASALAGAFSNAFKDIDVADGKDLALAGQWRRYNDQTPHQAADAYFTGNGAPLNYERARHLYLKISAESRERKTAQGMLDERGRLALRRLGEIYAKGLGVERNWEQAKIFYSEAATARDVPSMVALAEYYSAEKATHTDLLAAYSWYNKLAAVTPGSFAFATASDNGETYRMLADATRKRDALEKKLSTDELRRAQGL